MVPVSTPHDEVQVHNDEELVDYEASPEHSNMVTNMVNLHFGSFMCADVLT